MYLRWKSPLLSPTSMCRTALRFGRRDLWLIWLASPFVPRLKTCSNDQNWFNPCVFCQCCMKNGNTYAAKLAVYDEIRINVKNHQTEPTIRPDTERGDMSQPCCMKAPKVNQNEFDMLNSLTADWAATWPDMWPMSPTCSRCCCCCSSRKYRNVENSWSRARRACKR